MGNTVLIDVKIEIGLGSPARWRILRAMASRISMEDWLTRYRIHVLTGLKTKDVDRNLNILLNTGWIKEVAVGESSKYTLNLENRETQGLVDFMRSSRYLSY